MTKPREKETRPVPESSIPPADRSGTSPAHDDEHQDPDRYDPVGMAGKKAGVLLELGEEADEAAAGKEE